MGTLGLTEKDVEAVRKVEGVEWAEGAWSTDVLCGEAEAQKVLHVEAVNEDVNTLTVTEGQLPEKAENVFWMWNLQKRRGIRSEIRLN